MATTTMPTPLYRRSPDLIAAILDAVYEHPDPIAWTDLVHAFTTTTHPAKTVENTLHDLIAYGALHRIGQPGTRRRPDTRAIRQTVLGRHWHDQTNPPPPPERTRT